MDSGEDTWAVAALAAVPMAVLVVDAQAVRYANAAAGLLLGVPAESLVGRPLDAAYASVRAVGSQALAGTEVRDLALSADLPDGSSATLVAGAAPLRAGDGAVTGAVIVLRDVTPERAAEARRAESQRRAEQQHRRESLGALAGGIAHDFNNVLAAMSLTAEAVARRLAPGSDERGDIESIAPIAQRGVALTRQLSAFARGRPSYHDVVDLNDAVRAADTLLPRTLDAHVSRVLHLSSAPCLVAGDLAELRQVVINLATNAGDAMPDGGQLTLSSALVELDEADRAVMPSGGAGPHVLLTVTDDGMGMPREVADRAFEPFFTTKALGVGTGLGLAMVLGVAEQAGGGAWLHSEPGVGTTVRVAWPAKAAAVAVPAAASGAAAAGRRLVVVEDEPALRNAMVRVLRADGYVVEAHPDGLSARAASLAWTEVPDLLLTDVVLPGLTGPALIDAARERFPGLRVLLISGYAGDMLGGRAAADTHLLEKPFDSAALLSAVGAAISRS